MFLYRVRKISLSTWSLMRHHDVCFSDLSGPFSEPMYEKILRVVKEIKKSVTTIVKAFQDKEMSVGGEENLFNPLAPKISLVILLNVCHIVVAMLVWRI